MKLAHRLHCAMLMTAPFNCLRNVPYNITARTNNKDWFQLPLDSVWTIMCDYLYFIHHAYNIQIYSFVLMANHFHLLAGSPEANLSQAMNYFMRETSKIIGDKTHRINKIYGGRYYRCAITDYHHFINVYKYNYRNPVEARICERVEEYKYSTLNHILGISRCEIPIVEDGVLFSGLHFNWSELDWLNRAPHKSHQEAMRLGLRKREFQLTVPRGEVNHPLEFIRY